jgi:hypothetical protein
MDIYRFIALRIVKHAVLPTVKKWHDCGKTGETWLLFEA